MLCDDCYELFLKINAGLRLCAVCDGEIYDAPLEAELFIVPSHLTIICEYIQFSFHKDRAFHAWSDYFDVS